MREWQSQAHVKWYCRYHIVIVPKYRRKSMFGAMRREVGEIFKELCRRFGIELVEGHVMRDPVHMCLGILPKYSVANTVGEVERQGGDHDSPEMRSQEEFRGVEVLGPGVLCQHGRVG